MTEKAAKLFTPEFRVSFAHVFQPQPPMAGSKPDAKPKYSVTMLFPAGADLSKLKAAAAAAAQEKFGKRLADPVFAAKVRSPFRDQGEKPELEGYVKGCIFINATSQQKPGLVDPDVNPIIEQSQFYNGCYAIATVNAFAYEQISVGVAFGLNNVQKTRDGEPLGGRTRPEDDFKRAAPAAASASADATGLFA